MNEQNDHPVLQPVLPPIVFGFQALPAPDLPPLRRVTFADVQRIAAIWRARRVTP